tara:strand:+ start:6516 stop:8279 length:1764 start_codon:yes stop_codon:yes gene_type:complete
MLADELPAELGEEEDDYSESYDPEGYDDNDMGPGRADQQGFMGGFGPRGRSVSVPLWNRASNAPKTARLRVQYVEVDGNQSEIGHLPYDASLEVLITKWPKSGTFLITPIDQMNRAMSHDPLKFTIAEDHDILRKVVAAKSGSVGVGGLPNFVAPQMPPEVWEFLRTQQVNSEAQIKILQSQLENRNDEMRDKDSQISKERMALAMNNTTAALDVQQQLISRDQERQDQTQQNMVMHWENMSSAAEQRHQMALERMKAEATQQNSMVQANQQMMIQMMQNSNEADRRRMEDERERTRIAREEEKKWEAERRSTEREENNARDKERWELQRRDEDRQHQHHERQIELLRTQSESSDPFSSIEKLLEKGTGIVELVKVLGIDKLLGGAGTPTGFLGMASDTVGKAIEGYLEIAKIQAGATVPGATAPPQIESQEQQYQVQLPDGQTAVMTESELQAYQAQVAAYQEQSQGAAAQAPEGNAGAPAEPPPQAPEEPFNPFAANLAKLDPKIQKKSRKSIRETVELLKQADDKKWEAIITAQLTKVPETIEYLAACSVAYAMNEAGADAKMVTGIISQIKKMELDLDKIRLS